MCAETLRWRTGERKNRNSGPNLAICLECSVPIRLTHTPTVTTQPGRNSG
jgi:hypothetical protein